MTKEIHVIRKAHTLVAFDRKLNGHVYLNDADVAYDEKGFVHVGGHYDGPFVSESSGRDRMILPGFVNVHCHSGEEPISKGIFEDMGTAAPGAMRSTNTPTFWKSMTMRSRRR